MCYFAGGATAAQAFGATGQFLSMAAKLGAQMSAYRYRKEVHRRNVEYTEEAGIIKYGTLGVRYQQARDIRHLKAAKIKKETGNATSKSIVRQKASGVDGITVDAVVTDIVQKGLSALGLVKREQQDAEAAFISQGKAIENEMVGRILSSDPGPPPNFATDALGLAAFGAQVLGRGTGDPSSVGSDPQPSGGSTPPWAGSPSAGGYRALQNMSMPPATPPSWAPLSIPTAPGGSFGLPTQPWLQTPQGPMGSNLSSPWAGFYGSPYWPGSGRFSQGGFFA